MQTTEKNIIIIIPSSLGISAYCSSLQATVATVAHVAVFFWLVSSPLQAKRHQVLGHFRFLHIGVVALLILLPIGPIVAIFATGGFRPFFHPHTCVTANIDAAFYTVILPHSIITAIILSLLILLVWMLVKSRWRDIILMIKLKASKVSKLNQLLEIYWYIYYILVHNHNNNYYVTFLGMYH